MTLLPCYHCSSFGHRLSVTDSYVSVDDGEITGFCVECSVCQCCGPIRDTQDEAVAKWNEIPRYCDHCDEWRTDLESVDDPWGKPHDWWCGRCADNYDGPGDDYYEGLAEDVADRRHKEQQAIAEAGR